MAINYRAYIDKVDQKIRAEERTAGPNNKAGIQKINTWHIGKNKMEVFARELYQIEGELTSLIQDEKASAAKGRALDGKLKQMDAELKKMKAACTKATKDIAANKAKAKTPAQKKQFEVYANKMQGQRDAVMRDGQRKEQIFKQELAKRKEMMAEYKRTTSAITSLRKKGEKKMESIKKIWDGLPK